MNRTPKGMLLLKSPHIIDEYIRRTGVGQDDVIEKFYTSKLYEMLEDEATKMWHFSVDLLCDMFQRELEGEEIIVLEEG